VAKRRLEKAAAALREAHGDVDVQVTWRPFFLDPDMPAEADKRERYMARMGEATFTRMEEAMRQRGLGEGIHFSYGGKVGNTINAHRVVELALERGGREAQDKVVEELMQNYFEQEKHIGDPAVLEHALKKGLPNFAEDFSAFLKSDTYTMEVLQQAQMRRMKYQISGVPFMIFGTVDKDVLTVSGAQETEQFSAALQEVLQAL